MTLPGEPMNMNITIRQDAASDPATGRAAGTARVATMFSNLRRQLGRRLACQPAATDARAAGPGSTELERHHVLRALTEAASVGRRVTLREIHRLALLSQPAALRSVRHLEQAGAIVVETVDHDPLSGEIRLP
jgi:DNA-binding MarR family transcriptional regulator